MIIYGWMNRERTRGFGSFDCPACGPQHRYVRIRVERWFFIYFLPLFQTETMGEYVQCRSCSRTFDTNILFLTMPTPEPISHLPNAPRPTDSVTSLETFLRNSPRLKQAGHAVRLTVAMFLHEIGRLDPSTARGLLDQLDAAGYPTSGEQRLIAEVDAASDAMATAASVALHELSHVASAEKDAVFRLAMSLVENKRSLSTSDRVNIDRLATALDVRNSLVDELLKT